MGTKITVAARRRSWYSRPSDARKADREKIHVTSIWSKRLHSGGRQLVHRSVLEGCCGTRKTAESTRENLPDLRSRQTLSIRTEAQGQGNIRGQRSGYRRALRKSRLWKSRYYVSRTGRDLVGADEEPQAQAGSSVNSFNLGELFGKLT